MTPRFVFPMWSFWVVFKSTGSFINPFALRNLAHKTTKAMTASSPNTLTPATPPIRTGCLPWPESVDIKQVNTFQKRWQTDVYFKSQVPERGENEGDLSSKDQNNQECRLPGMLIFVYNLNSVIQTICTVFLFNFFPYWLRHNDAVLNDWKSSIFPRMYSFPRSEMFTQVHTDSWLRKKITQTAGIGLPVCTQSPAFWLFTD